MFCLTLKHQDHGRVVPLPTGSVLIGAAAECDVRFSDLGLSPRHARLSVTGQSVRVRDLGSSTGTFVDARRVEDEQVRPPRQLGFGPSLRARLERLDLVLGTLVGRADASELLDAFVRAGDATRAITFEWAGTGGDETVIVHAAGGTLAWDERLRSALRRVRSSARDHGSLLLDPTEALIWAREGSGSRSTVHLLSPTPESSLSSESLQAALGVVAQSTPQPSKAAAAQPVRRRFELAGPGSLTGRAPSVLALHRRMNAALTSELPVLLTGETGVGKELYARSLHALSKRASGPFVALNVAALPVGLAESLLFGTEAGTATGVKAQRGLLREADHGVVLLDEIGELAPELQAKLLRVVELREVLPLGATRPVAVDLRFIAATNRDLEAEVEEGRFRPDLYHRLCGHEYRIPALRERRADVPALVSHFLRAECRRLGQPATGVTIQAMRALSAHAWPGNVRQLQTLMRRLANELEPGEPVRESDLPEVFGRREPLPEDATLDERIDAFQRPVVKAALDACGGNRTAAAELLGVSRPRLRRTLEKLGLDGED